MRNSLEELSMNRVLRLFSRRAVCGVLFLWATILGATSANATDKVFVSRTAEIDGVKLHYTTGGHGTPLILLHGYAETSRMWTPILPLLGEKFTVIAPDLPGIGDSSIPADGLDMKSAAIRIHALARTHKPPSSRCRAPRHRLDGGLCVRGAIPRGGGEAGG